MRPLWLVGVTESSSLLEEPPAVDDALGSGCAAISVGAFNNGIEDEAVELEVEILLPLGALEPAPAPPGTATPLTSKLQRTPA